MMRTKLLSLMLAAVLFFSFLGCAEMAAGRASDETVFEVALESLKQYNDAQSVNEAAEMFSQIMSGYNSASLFKSYAEVIAAILSNTFDGTDVVLTRLAERESFVKLLEKYNLPSCEDLTRYIAARRAESAGDYATASEIYASIEVFDSFDRLTNLDIQHIEDQAIRYTEAEAEFTAGHYAAAAEIWRELGDYRDSAERMAKAVELGATPTPSPSPSPSPEPTLVPRSSWPEMSADYMSMLGDSPVVFGSNYQRKQIKTISFVGSLSGVPDDGTWDISKAGNGSVLAWVTPSGSYYDLTIAGEGGVRAPANCVNLFAAYDRLETIHFNNCFNTSNVTVMYCMFHGCSNLQNLDLSDFNTSNVVDMGNMFNECSSLQNLDLSSFDTSNVTDMENMFNKCDSLLNLDLSSFDTSSVTDMSWMFRECSSLHNLRTSTGFVIRDDAFTGGMFQDCFIKNIN